jgi:hypothetical protein
MWSPVRGQEPPTVNLTRLALEQYQFPPERAADIPGTTAFRRAVRALESDTYKTVCWHDKRTGATYGQMDELKPDADRMTRHRIAGWKHTTDEDTGADVIEGNPLEGFEQAKRVYSWADVTKVIQNVLTEDGLGAFTPRRAGGIYFVPIRSKSLLDQLCAFCSAVGVNLLRYDIPDTAGQRAEIADAIVASITADLDQHAEAIAAYDTETRLGVVENRRASVQQTAQLLSRLAHLINGRLPEIQTRISGLFADLDRAAAHIEEAREQARFSGPARRIVSGAPQA